MLARPLRLVLLSAVTLAAACVRPTVPAPVSTETIAHSVDEATAANAAAEGLADIGLDVDVATSGSVQSGWNTSAPPATRLAPWRRFKLSVRVDPRAVAVRPLAEECDAAGCMPVSALGPDEAAILRRAVEAIRSRLDAVATLRPGPTPYPAPVAQATIVEREVVERQVARDPEPPTGRGPVVIPTRVGPTEISAGVHVEVELLTGSRVYGRVNAVSADGLAVELSPGREVILWAGDISVIRVR